MSKTVVFNSGIPTEPDVKRLLEKFDIPSVGALVRYDDIAKTIGEERHSGRFGSVVGAWRKVLERDHNVIFRAIPNTGFEVMDPESRILYAASCYKHGLRKIGKASARAEQTDPSKLGAESSRVRDHLVRVSSAIRLEAATQARRLKSQAA